MKVHERPSQPPDGRHKGLLELRQKRRRQRRPAWGQAFAVLVLNLGFRGLGLRGLGLRGLGLRGLGLRGFGFRGLGFRGLGLGF